MYPLLKWNVVLVKQYEKSYIYNLSRKENGIIVSSHFMYEIINKDATYILELCNGARKIEDIVKILSEKIKQKSEDILIKICGVGNKCKYELDGNILAPDVVVKRTILK